MNMAPTSPHACVAISSPFHVQVFMFCLVHFTSKNFIHNIYYSQHGQKNIHTLRNTSFKCVQELRHGWSLESLWRERKHLCCAQIQRVKKRPFIIGHQIQLDFPEFQFTVRKLKVPEKDKRWGDVNQLCLRALKLMQCYVTAMHSDFSSGWLKVI